MKTTKTATKKPSKKATAKKWSKHVNETSNTLDLEPNIFKSGSAKKIAASLKASAEKICQHKGKRFWKMRRQN